MINKKQKFINKLKYNGFHSGLLERIVKFEEHVVKNHNGFISIVLHKESKHLVVTTYLPTWNPMQCIRLSNWSLYVDANNLFAPFMKKRILGYRIRWATDLQSINNGSINYYITVKPNSHDR